MIKNTNSNLFSMHYLFPFLLLDIFDKKDSYVHLKDLLDKLNLTSSQDSFSYVANFKHVFSHLTYNTYIYICTVHNSENMSRNQEHVWIKLKDIKDFTHNSFCQHIIDCYKKCMNEKKNCISDFCL
ncbi:hypothetical protein POWCR01_090030800 [Plasmodium ovale]|nr:hypothetical protein POWCR01_090030800 [Plasmodium ovale]